ncbi:NAD(P)H-dependent glycerol-3-phosphate dehydrogenase [Mesorhizobium sp. ZC-5]|uniref:NAD(P)H-dependent glycerol-3-phosphate dehydrogenase n=1 Tax=Mesorhizobium sp. ZC-5 TaxID=2986066 RepID=UPI0021E8825E|nr:NAD(P)H-dependent glycerol-3-phosphate dehydrogenase [Mesorhizobium sp. ZC-5]MCV3239122.1 NAD(P)-dependent glycerol-3-phosphate dehydrogenase [Mesorhizobium sp. ZC-5]
MSGTISIAVLGGGAWGSALASTARHGGHDVRLWARDGATVEAINERGENPRYLPGLKLAEGIKATVDLVEALRGVGLVLAAAPAQALRDMLLEAADAVPHDIPVMLCAKGIEQKTGRLLSEVVVEILPDNPIAALSGPSFATDVARGLPTAVVVAARHGDLAARLAANLSAPQFRCYSSDDLVGVEIGGALKNVLAIAAGAVIGSGFGASAQAAMVTRGFVELRRLGAAFGAQPETLMGLSGLGDLVLTCGSGQSRNFAYGLALGKGEDLAGRPLAEGVATAGVAAKIARERGVEAPIVDAVDRILAGEIAIRDAVAELMSRPLKSETD